MVDIHIIEEPPTLTHKTVISTKKTPKKLLSAQVPTLEISGPSPTSPTKDKEDEDKIFL